MKTLGLARLGKDAELRFMPDGTAVCNLALAVNYGKKGQDGKTPTQWIEASMWGKQAETLAPYMLKGSMHCFTLSDIHIETYQGQNGEGHKLVARVDHVELGPRQDAGQQQGQQPQRQAAPQQRQQQPARNGYAEQRGAPQPQRNAPPRNDSGFDDMSDVPF